MRVLLLTKYGPLGASSRLRTLQYLPRLRAAGFEFEVDSLLDDAYVAALYGRRSRWRPALAGYRRRFAALRRAAEFDVVWVEKEALPWVPWFVESGRIPRGPRLVVDYDDAIFHRYDGHRSALVRTVLAEKIPNVMRRADAVVAGSRYLADTARDAGARRVELIPTVVDPARYAAPLARPASARPVLGWIGSPDTVRFLARKFDAVATVAARHGAECIAIGARPDQVAGSVFTAVPWSEATEAAALARLDVGIMPLDDTPWERGKCAYKLVQYMASGVPFVASPVGANTDVVAGGDAGLLATTDDEWIASIDALLRDASLRARMGGAGRALAERQYSLDAQWRPLAAVLGGGA